MTASIGEVMQDCVVDEVAPGIFRLDVPVPFSGLRQINLWLLRDGDGFTMIDCGFADAQTRQRIEAMWKVVLNGRPVTRLLITHFHPDHAGNCRFICERWGLRPQLTQLEWMAANVALKSLYSDDPQLAPRFYRQNGATDDLIDLYHADTILYDTGVELTDDHERLNAGDRLVIGEREWVVMTGQGHSPEMAMLYCADDDILIAGDQILPKISPNISVWPWEPLANPLREFLVSLEQLDTRVTSNTLVLPSHRAPFHDAKSRIASLREHHEERLALLARLMKERGEITATDLLQPLFNRRLDGHQLNFAMGEVIAHLNYMMFEGTVRRMVDRDANIRFSLC
ncbi:MBL fold metallo-hydrolase [Aquamicrobium segne]|uniref:MBL fold metallo-hydrolase n=1 Tax=Aquamicrobium segne TaxID=469547 RepID=A0ABW0GTC3_9HYPH